MRKEERISTGLLNATQELRELIIANPDLPLLVHVFVNDGVRVICSKCGASTKILVDALTANGVAGNATAAVIKAWNRRAYDGTVR